MCSEERIYQLTIRLHCVNIGFVEFELFSGPKSSSYAFTLILVPKSSSYTFTLKAVDSERFRFPVTTVFILSSSQVFLTRFVLSF